MFDLSGRVALVTGGNGGIGLAMAKGLASANARVILAGRDAAKGSTAATLIGGKATFLTADITDPEAVQRLVEESEAIEGRLDILVNNAGTSIRRQPEALSLTDWHTVMNTNLTSIFLCCQAVLPAMQRAGGGKIINIGSMLSIFGTSFGAAYAASKGGVVQLTRALATAWAKDGIQVNAVLPGWVETALTDRARTEVDGLYERVLSRTPAGRWGRPEDLAGVAVFLASAASDFVTGTAIPVDGGFSVQG
jgi:2-dehydro-3-deoxy-D-gluconate 5-dehydrogenase